MIGDEFNDMIAKAERRKRRLRTVGFAFAALTASIGAVLLVAGDWFGWTLAVIGVVGLLAFGKTE